MLGTKRRAAVLCGAGFIAGVFGVPHIPVSAAGGDVWARGVRYCAATHRGHGTWSGFGPAIDMNAPDDFGMAVRAPANGAVEVKTTGGEWGNSIHWMNTDRSERIHMAHLKALARKGRVESGDVIGYVGSTGRSDSPHLHASAWRGKAAGLVLSGVAVKAGRCYTSVGPLRARAPTTSVASTASRAARKGWTRGSWSVQLKCRDDWTGCSQTNYTLNGSDPRRYEQAMALESERRYTLRFFSRDGSGHAEPWRGPVTFGIDRTKPKIVLDEARTRAARVEAIAHAADPKASSRPASGVAGVRFSACPNDGGQCRSFAGRRDGSTWVGLSATLPPGEYIVQGRVADIAYNWTRSNTVPVTVPAG